MRWAWIHRLLPAILRPRDTVADGFHPKTVVKVTMTSRVWRAAEQRWEDGPSEVGYGG